MRISYDDLQRVLLATGFVPDRVDGPHQSFVHPGTGLTFSLPLGTRPARGLPTYASALQGLLDLSGILSRADFEAHVLTPPRQPRRPRARQPATG